MPDWAASAGRDQYGRYAIIQVPGTDITQRLRWISLGTFRIGSPPEEVGRYGNEGPQKEVTFADGFWLFDTPVTQALWQAVTGENPGEFKSPDRPVETVSFKDATGFISKLNALVPGLRLSLPSEAEWEYACRAGTQDATYAGNLQSGEKTVAPVLDKIAWYLGNSSDGFDLDNGYGLAGILGRPEGSARGGTRPVGLKDANHFGLYDMLGNVWEWCADHWHRDYDGLRPDGTARLAAGAQAGAAPVVARGGSWDGEALGVRAASRSHIVPEYRGNFLGFRCARVQSDSEAERRAGGANVRRWPPSGA
jgi:formylglycine-generating enzyme required for sulfatase activity